MHTIAEIVLNFSFILYLVFYIPQLVHNIRSKQINQLSFGFHTLLFIAATTDLYYGFGNISQWQYWAVSLSLFTCLCIQHIQIAYYSLKPWYQSFSYLTLTFIIICLIIGLFITLNQVHPSHLLFITMGWIERICIWCHAIPQLIKNKQSPHAATSISPLFLNISIITGLCDWFCAWVFHWGAPTLYGAPISIIMNLWLIKQFMNISGSHTRYQALL